MLVPTQMAGELGSRKPWPQVTWGGSPGGGRIPGKGKDPNVCTLRNAAGTGGWTGGKQGWRGQQGPCGHLPITAGPGLLAAALERQGAGAGWPKARGDMTPSYGDAGASYRADAPSPSPVHTKHVTKDSVFALLALTHGCCGDADKDQLPEGAYPRAQLPQRDRPPRRHAEGVWVSSGQGH